MRKPLVVICAAAAALVLAGGVATAAHAGETPDGPGFDGFALPGWGWPDFGDGDDSGDWGWSAGSGSDSSGVDGAAADDAGSDGAASGDGSASGHSAADDASASAAGGSSAADGGSGSAAGDSASGGSHAAAANRGSGGASARSNADARPARSLTQRQAGAAPQRPATTLATSARRAVTSADVSSSPSSPVQQQLLALMNQSRRGGGCDALSVDRRLIDAANEHAADMARRRYFAHESPNGDSAGDRVSEAGYRWKRYGENIARGADSAYEVWNGWMHSPEHRHNILDCRLHQMGIGLALSGDGTPYWVQDFATPLN